MKLCKGAVLALAVSYGLIYCHTNKSKFMLEQKGDSLTLIHITNPTNYILLPIEEAAEESRVRLDIGDAADTDMDIRLAQTKVDYWVPFVLPADAKTVTVRVQKSLGDALCWKEMKLSDTFDPSHTDKFRPVYHHAPLYGWMNNANGLVYEDEEYHLYYQYNPYGSKWGNMHWGHSVSKDLMHWEHLAPAIVRDTLGHIFSGSSIVDQENVAGYGTGTILAFYTSASDKNGQIQCLAYSNDNGRTFTKYDKNPILRSSDRRKDFRDPKVFWYAPGNKWIMIVAADKEMCFYDSEDLKDWNYMSSFGEGYGVQPCQFECPDMVELPVDGDTEHKKWALIVNVNPGCYFGGSATQYFIGDFDGTRFICDSKPDVTKWLDWGKDHYATVTWSDAPDNRRIAIAWMSNWQYANDVPTSQYRSPNSVPRDLGLFTVGGETYLQSAPSPELQKLRDISKKRSFRVNGTRTVKEMIPVNEGAYEIELSIKNLHADVIGFRLYNDKGEEVDMQYDMKENRFSMDRRRSGDVGFNENFPALTWTAVESGKNELKLHLFVDKSSVEAFGDGGRFAMTNQVFPSEPYNHIDFYSKGGAYKVDSFIVYRLKQ